VPSALCSLEAPTSHAQVHRISCPLLPPHAQSIVLSKYLEHSSMPLDGCNVLEIGSGTGAVGLAAAVLGAANVTMTDLDYTLDNLRSAVAANTAVLPDGTGVRVAELDW